MIEATTTTKTKTRKRISFKYILAHNADIDAMWVECLRFKLHYGPTNTQYAERIIPKYYTKYSSISINHSISKRNSSNNSTSHISSTNSNKTAPISKTFMVKCEYMSLAFEKEKRKRQRKKNATQHRFYFNFRQICFKSNWFNCLFQPLDIFACLLICVDVRICSYKLHHFSWFSLLSSTSFFVLRLLLLLYNSP